jgi:hypothetical protein
MRIGAGSSIRVAGSYLPFYLAGWVVTIMKERGKDLFDPETFPG